MKFETTILEKQQNGSNSVNNNSNNGSRSKQYRNSTSINEIIGFTALEQEKNKLDIKMNILLSMSRIGKDFGRARNDMHELDITNYYKYLEIQPYYGHTSKELIPEYQLFSVLNVGNYFTTYLGRKISDGRFYSVKICRSDLKLSQNQYNFMKILHH